MLGKLRLTIYSHRGDRSAVVYRAARWLGVLKRMCAAVGKQPVDEVRLNKAAAVEKGTHNTQLQHFASRVSFIRSPPRGVPRR